ncbi:MAG: hypothetical protein V2A72_00975 [Candidatus Omnitrophota bacterium]
MQFRIFDTSTDYNDVTTTDSEAFAITGSFTFVAPAPVFAVENNTPSLDIKWFTIGDDISKVKLEYYNENDSQWKVINASANNDYWNVGNTNTYTWDTLDGKHVNKLPLNLASDDIQFKITASTPNQPSTEVLSSKFVICGDITVTSPGQSDIWVANGSTTNTIAWDVYGKVDYVKITYTRDNWTTTSEVLVASMLAEDGDADPNQGAWGWQIPTNPKPAEGKGDYITRVDAPSSDFSNIRVEDTSYYGTYAQNDSANFKVKGQLTLIAPDVSGGLYCGTTYQVTWQRDGRINAVNVKFATDGATYTGEVELGRAFDNDTDTQQSLTNPWTFPESPITTSYSILVEDANYKKAGAAGTFIPSAPFKAIGALSLTAPLGGDQTWSIGETRTITWSVVHGELSSVEVLAATDGNFDGANMYVVETSLDPFNVSLYDGVPPVGSGKYDWVIPTDATLTAAATTKFRVRDVDTVNFPEVKSTNTSASIKMVGSITVTAPTSDWIVGATDREVKFRSYGETMGTVWIYLYDGSSEKLLCSSSGVATNGDGNEEIFNVPQVPDVKSKDCKLRVRDAQSNPNAQGESSGTFYTYPTISDVVVTNSVGDEGASPKIWRAGLSNQKVDWIENDIATPSLISTVEILYTAGGGTPDTPLTLGDGGITHEKCEQVIAPTALSFDTAKIRVRDADANFQGKIYKDSGTFRLLGRFVYGTSPVLNDTWFIGDTTRQVTWTAYGAELQSVGIYIDYDGPGGNNPAWILNESTTPGAGDSWTWPTVPDQITEVAKFYLKDADTDRGLYTSYPSNQFKIGGKFTNIEAVSTLDPPDDEVVAGLAAKITWVKTGAAISDVTILYTKNGTNWYNIVDNVENGTTTVTNNQNCPWTPPATCISDSCLIKITDPDNPLTTGQSAGNFIIASKVKVLQPDTNDEWSANSTEIIEWQKWGTFATVNVYYRPNASTNWGLLNTSGPVASHNGNGLDGSWQWYIDGSTILSLTAQIKVEDAVNTTARLSIPSDEFTTKGSLEVLWPNGTDYNVYEAGIAKNIKWKRYGNITGVKLFLNDGTSGYVLMDEWWTNGIVDFVGSEQDHTVEWTPSETVGKTWQIKVQDKNNSTVENPSVQFQVKGKLQITDPDAQQRTWKIGTTQTIKWDVIHGSIANVKIIASRSGSFTGEIGGSDIFLIINQTDADNVTTFDPNGSPYVAQGKYDWFLNERTPTIIGDQTYYRVMEADTDYDVKSTSLASNTITGKITVNAPASGDLWKVRDGGGQPGDDPAKTVSWTCEGKVLNVDILFYNGSSLSTIAEDVASVEGSSNTWTTNNWIGGNGVADAKSIHCYIQVKDTQFGVTDDSDEFKVYPKIVVNTPAEGVLKRAESSGNIVAWTTPGSALVTSVDILLDFNAGTGGFPSQLKDDYAGVNPCNTIVFPANLSEIAVVRVQDSGMPAVYGDSYQFKIHGSIDPADGAGAGGVTTPIDDWTIGTSQEITWDHVGNISQVNIWIDYDDTTGFHKIANAVSAAGESWVWQSVVDNASNNAKIMVEDANANRTADTHHTSGAFDIVGKFAIETPATGNMITYGEPFQITWYPTGASVTHVDISYNVDGGGYVPIPEGQNKANTGNPASVWWILADNVSSDNGTIKIVSHHVNNPATEAISELFAIHGDIDYDPSSPEAGDNWVVGQTDKVIDWDISGKVDSVDIQFAKDGENYDYPIATDLDSVTNPPPFLWDIPTNQDILSKQIGKIKVKDHDYEVVYDESPPFSIQGVLSNFNITFPPDSGQFPNVLRVQTAAVITWARTGSTMGNVYIRYSIDRGLGWPLENILQTKLSGDGATGWSWPVTDVITRDSVGAGTGVVVRVESVDDDRVYCGSGMLSIMGRIDITNPDQQAHVWVVGTTNVPLQWTPTKGTYTPVKIEYNTAYDFSGQGATITSSATNTGPGVPATYSWPQIPNFIQSAVYIRVSDSANSDLTYDRTAQAYPCKIRGSITGVSKPVSGATWYVGATDKLVEWTANGSIQSMELALATGVEGAPEDGSYTVISPAGGASSGSGTHDWLTGNWNPANDYNGGVMDAKSDKCYIRVKDLNDEDVPAMYSAKFTVKPKITLSNMPTQWVAGTPSGTLYFNGVLEEHKVTWSIPGSQVTNVDVVLSYTGGEPYTVTLGNDVPFDEPMPYVIPGTLPATLTPTAKIKVCDYDELFADLVKEESVGTFKIIGGLNLIHPVTNEDWKVGETNQVTWTPYGNMGGNVDVYYKYDGGNWCLSPVASGTAASGVANWNIPDHVSENVYVRIKDAIHPNDTWDDSSLFHIMAKFDITFPEGGDTIIAEDQINIVWDKYYITSLTHAKLEYSTENGAPGSWDLITDGIDDGDGNDFLVVNSQSCPWTPLDTDLSEGCIIKITDPGNANSEVQGEGTFKIEAEITCTAPIEGADPIVWEVGTTQDISWTYKGDFPNVSLYYSATGVVGDWILIDEEPTIYPYGPDDGDSQSGNKAGAYKWVIPSDTDLSAGVAKIYIAKSDEPLIVNGPSDAFTMKGRVDLLRPKPSQFPQDETQRVYGGDVPQYCFIDWNKSGEIDTVGVKYSTDGINYIYINEVPTDTATLYNWAISGALQDIIGEDRTIMVYDTADETNTQDISEEFDIKGEIKLDYPVGGETFVVGLNETIQWTPYGNFPGNQVLLSGSTDNFGSNIFKIAIRPAGAHNTPQTYQWNVMDTIEGAVPISTQVRIRVQDNNEFGATKVVKDTSTTLTIKGALEVNAPTQVWKVGDTNRSITWDYDGPITVVDLFVRNAANNGWIQVTPAEGIDCSAKQYTGFAVPDAISNTSNNTTRLRIKDHNDPTGTVEDESGTFIIRGVLTFRTDMPYEDQVFVVGPEQQGYDNDLFWNMKGSFTTLEIRYSTNNGDLFPDENIIEENWPAGNVYTWSPVEDDMSLTVKFKIYDTRDPDNVSSMSERVQIAGSVTVTHLTDYNDPQYATESFPIYWDKTGLLLQNVDIYYSINGGDDLYPYEIDTNVSAAQGVAGYPWVPGITDPLSPDARIKIFDHDNPTGAYDYSPHFDLRAKWEWDETNENGDPANKVFVVGEDYDLEWITTGLVPNVRIDYDVHGNQTWEDPPLELSKNNSGYYKLNFDSSVKSDTVLLRISDVNNENSKLDCSDAFKVRCYVKFTSPEDPDTWYADETNTIYWESRGAIGNVNIYASYNDSAYDLNKLTATPIDGTTGDVGFPWKIPSNHTTNNVNLLIAAVDDPTQTSDESEEFTISSVLTLQNPDGLDEWVPGDTEVISWSKNGTIDYTRVQYSPTGFEVDYATIPNGSAVTGVSVPWNVPDEIGISNKIRIFNPNNATQPTQPDESEAFRIKPRLGIVTPAKDEVVPINLVGDGDALKYVIQWTVDGSMSKVELQIKYGAGDYTTIPGADFINAEITPGSGAGQFLWRVPSPPHNEVKIRVVCEDSGQTDVLDEVGAQVGDTFKVAARLQLTQPNGVSSDVYEVDKPLAIMWQNRGLTADDRVKLEYSDDSGLHYDFQITDANGWIPTTQSYPWTIPNCIGEEIMVKVSDNAVGTYTISDESDDIFEIRGWIEFDRPLGWEKWVIGTTEAVQWQLHGTISTVMVEFSVAGVIDPDPIKPSIAGDTTDYSGAGEPDGLGQALWFMPNDAVGKNNVRIKITNLGDSDVNVTSNLFTVKGDFRFEAPNDAPLIGARWPVNTSKTIKWTTYGDVPKIRIYYTLDGTDPENADWEEITEDPVNGDDNVDQFPWTVTNVIHPTDNDLAMIKIEDKTNNETVGYSDMFVIHDLLNLTRPNGTDNPLDAKILLVGTTEEVEWISAANSTGGSGPSTVRIQYCINYTDPPAGNTWLNLVAGGTTDNDGTQDCVIPNDINDAVRVRVSDANDVLVYDVSTNNCMIKPNFIYYAPLDATTWYCGDTTTKIQWQTFGTVASVYMKYRYDGGEWLNVEHVTETQPFTNDDQVEWVIPVTGIPRVNDAQIKIISSTDPNATKESALFDIKGRLTVDYPTDTGELFRCGTVEPLEWSTKGDIPTVGIKYFQPGAGWQDIKNEQGGNPHPNTGSFDWTVANVEITSGALIRVYDIEGAFNDVYGESLNGFEIRPRIIFSAALGDEPVGEEEYLYATPQTFKWTTYGPVSKIDIEISKNGLSGTWLPLGEATNIDNVDSYSTNMPDMVSTNCYLRVKSHNKPNDISGNSGKFTIRTDINLITPNGGVDMYVGNTTNVRWTQDGATDTIYIYYIDNNVSNIKYGANGGTGIVNNPAPVGGIRTWEWTIPDFINNNVKIGVADPNDIAETKDESASIFSIRPKFVISNPYRIDANNYSKWDIGTTQTIQWTWTGIVATAKVYYSLDGLSFYEIDQVDQEQFLPDRDAEYDWFVDPEIGDHTPIPVTPSPNFYIKVEDAADDDSFIKSGKAKVMADFEIDDVDDEYVVGDTCHITWSCVGEVDNVALHYSTDDGETFPESKLIIGSTPNGENGGTYDWPVADDIDHEVRLRVKSSIDDDALDISPEQFRIKGAVWVKSPQLDDPWEIGITHNIMWGWKGTIPEMYITYSYDGGGFNPILEDYETHDDGIVGNGAGAGGPNEEYSYTWTIPDDASPNVIVRVQDSRTVDEADVTDDSENFHIVGYLIANKPDDNDRWDVASTHYIKWEWGGSLEEVKISLSQDGEEGDFTPITDTYEDPDDGIVPNGAGVGGPNSEHSYLWTVQDAISTNCVIKIEDPDDDTVLDYSEPFKIQGAFTMITPVVEQNEQDVYECRWVTNERRKISWDTFGTIDKVDLVYCHDNFIDINPEDGVPDNEIAMVNATNINNIDEFNWIIPDDRSATVKVRVYDHGDHEVFATGPVAAGGVDTMKIDYYKITWDIRDLLTNAPIEGLSINCTSGWDATGVATPIMHETPAGVWNGTSNGLWTAEWTHKDFGPISENYLVGWDNDAQEWKGDRTIYRTMETLVVHIWRAYSEFAYDVNADRLDITSWLERDGSLVPGSLITDVTIYDGNTPIKRKTVIYAQSAGKLYYYDDVPAATKLWIGDRFGEIRTLSDVIADCLAYKTSEAAIPANFGGFYIQSWLDTAYTLGGVNYANLQSAKVYVAKSYAVIATGATFTTPVSFEITIPKTLDEVKDIVVWALNKPMSEVEAGIQQQLNIGVGAIIKASEDMADIIEERIGEGVVQLNKTTNNLVNTFQAALTSFEQKTDVVIAQMGLATDKATVATDMMYDAAEASYISSMRDYFAAGVNKDPIKSGEELIITLFGKEGFELSETPEITIYNYQNKTTVDRAKMKKHPKREGSFVYSFRVNASIYSTNSTLVYMMELIDVDKTITNAVSIMGATVDDVMGVVASLSTVKGDIDEVKTTVEALQNELLSGELQDTIPMVLSAMSSNIDKMKKEMTTPETLSKQFLSQMKDMNKYIRQVLGEEGISLQDQITDAFATDDTLTEVKNSTQTMQTGLMLLQRNITQKLGQVDQIVTVGDGALEDVDKVINESQSKAQPAAKVNKTKDDTGIKVE